MREIQLFNILLFTFQQIFSRKRVLHLKNVLNQITIQISGQRTMLCNWKVKMHSKFWTDLNAKRSLIKCQRSFDFNLKIIRELESGIYCGATIHFISFKVSAFRFHGEAKPPSLARSLNKIFITSYQLVGAKCYCKYFSWRELYARPLHRFS